MSGEFDALFEEGPREVILDTFGEEYLYQTDDADEGTLVDAHWTFDDEANDIADDGESILRRARVGARAEDLPAIAQDQFFTFSDDSVFTVENFTKTAGGSLDIRVIESDIKTREREHSIRRG